MAKFKFPDPDTYLSPEDQLNIIRITQAKVEVREAMRKYNNLIDCCTHVLPPLTEDMKEQMRNGDDHLPSNSDNCVICRSWFGWRCPDSPDSVCHYYTELNGMIKMIDKSEVQPPDGHSVDFETDDECIFCGQPQERK